MWLRKKIAVLRHLSTLLTQMDIQTFVFVDSETTGLPFQECNRTKITELSFAVVESSHLALGVFPRVLNKLNLCFNPRKPISIRATELTGLSNDLLEYQPSFGHDTVESIKTFLSLFTKPICLVAHNGYRFDYPIMRKEFSNSGNSLPDDILCCDSLDIFRMLHQEDIKAEEIKEQTDIPIDFQDGFDELLVHAIEDIERAERIRNVQIINETTPKKEKDEIDSKGIRRQNCNSAQQPASRVKINYGNPSFKLEDIYNRLTNKTPFNAHRAESDTIMLIECAATLGSRFIKTANANCKKFDDIPCMGSGKQKR